MITAAWFLASDNSEILWRRLSTESEKDLPVALLWTIPKVFHNHNSFIIMKGPLNETLQRGENQYHEHSTSSLVLFIFILSASSWSNLETEYVAKERERSICGINNSDIDSPGGVRNDVGYPNVSRFPISQYTISTPLRVWKFMYDSSLRQGRSKLSNYSIMTNRI